MAMLGTRKLLGGLIGTVAGAAKHAVWYLRYHSEGATRDHHAGREAGERKS